MKQSLSTLVDNLAELHKNLPDNVLIQRFYNTNQLSDNNIKTFKTLLRKDVYPYESMKSFESKKFK